jgi:hypothetical protein
MDLGTIRKKLSRRQYLSPESFITDVRLVWSNAWTYNRPGDEIYVMAEKLSDKFEELVTSKPVLKSDSEASSAKKALEATSLACLNAEGWREYGFLNHTEGRIRRQAAWNAKAKARMEADKALTGQSGYDVSFRPPISFLVGSGWGGFIWSVSATPRALLDVDDAATFFGWFYLVTLLRRRDPRGVLRRETFGAVEYLGIIHCIAEWKGGGNKNPILKSTLPKSVQCAGGIARGENQRSQ